MESGGNCSPKIFPGKILTLLAFGAVSLRLLDLGVPEDLYRRTGMLAAGATIAELRPSRASFMSAANGSNRQGHILHRLSLIFLLSHRSNIVIVPLMQGQPRAYRTSSTTTRGSLCLCT